jgi:hypothetical protein
MKGQVTWHETGRAGTGQAGTSQAGTSQAGKSWDETGRSGMGGMGRAVMGRAGTSQDGMGRLGMGPLGTGRSGTGRLRKKLHRTLFLLTGFSFFLFPSLFYSDSRAVFRVSGIPGYATFSRPANE